MSNFLQDHLRRGLIFQQAAILTLVSAALLAGSTNIGEFIFFRFVAGAGAFMLMAGVPVREYVLSKLLKIQER